MELYGYKSSSKNKLVRIYLLDATNTLFATKKRADIRKENQKLNDFASSNHFICGLRFLRLPLLPCFFFFFKLYIAGCKHGYTRKNNRLERKNKGSNGGKALFNRNEAWKPHIN